MPTLAITQRFVQHYRRVHLGGSDFHDKAKVCEHAFRGQEEQSSPFTFTWRSNANGEPIVGRGSESDPFVVGVTSKQLLELLDRDPSNYVMHVDATYKLSQVEYPLMVVGISDRMRSFHVVAFFIMSQQKQSHFTEALSMLRRIYTAVTHKQLTVRYVMADADKGQRNAVDEVLGVGNELINLMCYFHVAANIYKHSRGIPISLAARVSRDVADMHYAMSAEEYERIKTNCLKEWQKTPQLSAFASYFTSQWLASPFNRWQGHHTPCGFAATNNPVEQFNRAIKRDYTLRSRLKMGTLIEQLLLCVRTEAQRSRPFATAVQARPDVLRRVRAMQKANFIRVVSPLKNTIGFLTGSSTLLETSNVANVVSDQMERVYDPENRRTRKCLPITASLSMQKARMETLNMPGSGWPVDVEAETCECRFYYKMGYCVHLLHALSVRDKLDLFGRAKLVYRGRNKALREQSERQGAGRPVSNNEALQLE